MELGLSLGTSSRPFGFMDKPREASNQSGLGFNFNTSLSIGPVITKQRDQHQRQEQQEQIIEKQKQHNSDSTTKEDRDATNYESLSPSLKANNKKAVLQLDLLPHTPAVARMNPPPHLSFPWHPPLENAGSSSRGLEVNMLPGAAMATAENEAAEEEAALSSSPNSAASSIFQMDLCMFSRRGSVSTGEGYDQRGCSSRASDEDENGDRTRKKLRLSKEQSAFLEENFKEHSTVNPKQKIALAKQLQLRPRQVEVWFQNRRARTKLKQTEVNCEYLKRCCDTLAEENRRLQKELQELRALKTSNPFYMQLPAATTLTMCPSCERVATNSNDEPTSKAIGFPMSNTFHPTTPQHLELN